MKKDDIQTIQTEFFYMSLYIMGDKIDDMDEILQVTNMQWLHDNSTLEIKYDLYNKKC